jgi:hypothetical protein
VAGTEICSEIQHHRLDAQPAKEKLKLDRQLTGSATAAGKRGEGAEWFTTALQTLYPVARGDTRRQHYSPLGGARFCDKDMAASGDISLAHTDSANLKPDSKDGCACGADLGRSSGEGSGQEEALRGGRQYRYSDLQGCGGGGWVARAWGIFLPGWYY